MRGCGEGQGTCRMVLLGRGFGQRMEGGEAYSRGFMEELSATGMNHVHYASVLLISSEKLLHTQKIGSSNVKTATGHSHLLKLSKAIYKIANI